MDIIRDGERDEVEALAGVLVICLAALRAKGVVE